MRLQAALALHDQPRGAQQRVAAEQCHANQQTERRQPVPPAAAIGSTVHHDALQKPAQGDALCQSGHDGTQDESGVPVFAMRGIAPTELEGDAAEDQRQQHRDDRRVQRRQHDAVGHRERRHQPAAAQHQPRLVAVPHRRDRVHGVGPFVLLQGREQDTDAQVEAIQHDIGEDREGDDEGPDGGQVEDDRHGRHSFPAARPAVGASGLGAGSPRWGAWAISFRM